MDNKLVFESTNRLEHNKILYTNKSKKRILICDNDVCYSINPSFTIFTSPTFDNRYIVGQYEVVTDIRVRIDINEVKFNDKTGKYEKEIYTRDTTKTFIY